MYATYRSTDDTEFAQWLKLSLLIYLAWLLTLELLKAK
jgi:hypothetical protein